MYYRFSNGVFIKADTFKEAKEKFVDKVLQEVEDKREWHKCTCLGFNHRFGCPEQGDEIPY